ncbi:MAG: hypothetical protein AAGF87_13135 [Bacteroidota bacterium]
MLERFLILLAVVLAIRCGGKRLLNNETLIQQVDNFPFADKTYEVEVDSLGQLGDTIEVVRTKKWPNGITAYEETTNWILDVQMTVETYYTKELGDIFYQKISMPGVQTKSIFETIGNTDGRVISATLISIEGYPDQSRDTIFMDYGYTYSNEDLLRQMQITAHSDSGLLTDMYYDSKELPLRSVQYNSQDTFELELYTYRNDQIVRKETINYKGGEYSDISYNGQGDLDTVRIYTIDGIERELFRTIIYEFGGEGNVVAKQCTNHLLDEQDKSVFLRED